ncbi:MBL fold metallo-hydrolase [Pseudomonas sp. Choline-3u-10]|jgi:metallo-beta-lactamase family protein|uniref:MBL fold metallo-hydrolase RNA specificity domain-containing protein n=1 Tax=Pseudomonadaceae TaxID=135621 RepID=UPI000617AE18|nr:MULTISPECIES: MBL fold metallo-hydrolase [Pseudomonadaceae]MAL36384.1 MBL fold metallo-hydrolase [Pseudomonas sp.]MBU0950587.1 MBL fold metallo-hydrolase [Gammaproteobacteria bacterium]KJJ64305.1 beta-lactamase [Pseudomonas sp. 10B238]MBK3796576.1 MBL fold metallo-hydrolase [Stutzerimonas stutzeri]MBK3877079.1 MBL fold metallo-hydrolase [Stutzerimonas stutzeri]
MALLSFLGAIQQVTGSCYLIETHGGVRVLLDCGMRQGRREEEAGNRAGFSFDPQTLDAVVLSHAHIDHSGLLPKLVAAGFKGPIHVTEATGKLVELMLLDSANIQEKDAEWENRWRARLGKPAIKPLYTRVDTERMLAQRQPHAYGEAFEAAPGVSVSFFDAGHILGSAIVQVDVEDFGSTRRLVFSGDLGNACSPLMHAPTPLTEADVVLMESTYGDRDHRDHQATIEELAEILQQAHRDGGNVLMPSFAVGRTQDLIYYLGLLYHQGRVPQQVVFLDSPMAIGANAIYTLFQEQLEIQPGIPGDDNRQRIETWLPIFRATPTAEESMAINRFKSGAIIIAGSGMCNGGRILHHFKHNLWREECHLIIPGFQASGTLGRAIVDGAKTVKLMHQRIAVKAQVHTLGGFSAHAGQSQLIEWASQFKTRPELYLVHGELDKMRALQEALRDRLDWQANIPEPGDRIAL